MTVVGSHESACLRAHELPTFSSIPIYQEVL